MVQVTYRILHVVHCNWRCMDGSSDVQITAFSTVQLVVYWWIKWCKNYCIQCSANGGVLMVQVMYGILHALQCNWRWIDGSSDVQITTCSTVPLAVYWQFKWCTDYWMQCSATGGVLMVQVMYRLLHVVQCNWRCIDGSRDVQITACSALQLVVYWWFKWCTDFCMQYSASGGVLMVQVKYT